MKCCVFPVEPQSPNGKNINQVCTKSGVSADSRKSAKKCGEPHFLHTFYAKSAVFRTFPHFLALFLESAETPLFVQINVFAVWALRLDRKYTTKMDNDILRPMRRLGPGLVTI